MNAFAERARKLKELRLGVAGILVASLIATTALRSLGLFIHDLYWLQEGLGGDKVVHCLMGAGLMLSALLVVVPRSSRSITVLLLAVLALLSVEELSQLIAETRDFDLLDLAANYTGAIVTIVFFAVGSYLVHHKATYSQPAPAE
jgi:hypothetical protein